MTKLPPSVARSPARPLCPATFSQYRTVWISFRLGFSSTIFHFPVVWWTISSYLSVPVLKRFTRGHETNTTIFFSLKKKNWFLRLPSRLRSHTHTNKRRDETAWSQKKKKTDRTHIQKERSQPTDIKSRTQENVLTFVLSNPASWHLNLTVLFVSIQSILPPPLLLTLLFHFS